MIKYTLVIIFVLLSALVLMPKEVNILGQKLTRPNIEIKLGTREFTRDLDFKFGLDIKGGSSLVYQADTSQIDEKDITTAIEATRSNIERRINLLGVSESIVQTAKSDSTHRIIISIPGVTDVQAATNLIGATAKLEFKELNNASPSAFINTNLTGKDLKSARVAFSNDNANAGQPTVSISFSQEGAKIFADLTKRNVSKPIAIFLDGVPVTSPLVNEPILDGQAVISGQFTLEEAKNLAIQLNAGALPLPIKLVSKEIIGPSLGEESIQKSLNAGLIGFTAVAVFMVINYRKNGIIAVISLIAYILLSLLIFKLMPITLTLAGIAGFILSVGMAVDANILVFERMKEEIAWGRPKRAAMELGFIRAWSSVKDSNISSLITATILFWFGTGSVRGFATTLVIGILLSMFTAQYLTRSILRQLIR